MRIHGYAYLRSLMLANKGNFSNKIIVKSYVVERIVSNLCLFTDLAQTLLEERSKDDYTS